MAKTRVLLKAAGLLKVYTDTGLPFYWLRKVASGEIKNPSVNRVQYLYEHLTRTTLLG